MTELERKALMGDREAQRECTEKGIVLPCPFCGGKSEIGSTSTIHGTSFYVKCQNKCAVTCGHFRVPGILWRVTEQNEAIAIWNTRPALPVGRCKECQHYVAEWVGDGETIPAECIHPLTELFVVNDDDFCSCFEPKGDEGNEAQGCKS